MTVGTVLAVGLLGAGTAVAVIGGPARPGGPPAPVAGPPPQVLPGRTGPADALLGPDASVSGESGAPLLRLTGGAGSYGYAERQVVDVTRSFSVSAWVYDTAPGGAAAAVLSQGDGAFSSFELGRDDQGGGAAWSFRVRCADGAALRVAADAGGPAGAWTQLAGTYDADRRIVSLRVNGVVVASAEMAGALAPGGPLEFGRSRRDGSWGSHWAGALGRVQVWDRALEPAGDAGSGPVASWLAG